MMLRLVFALVVAITWPRMCLSQESVLPGFAPVQFDQAKMEARLYEKIYRWDNSMLPSEIISRSQVAGRVKLIRRNDGIESEIVPDKITVLENSTARVVIEATSMTPDGIDVRVKTVLDYDGVATISLDISASKPTKVDGIFLEAQVPKRASHEILAFRAETIRLRDTGRNDIIGNDDVLNVPYAGDFLNVLNFSDGDRSFWWFADNASGWDWAASNATEVNVRSGAYVLRQSFFGRGAVISTPKHIQFGLLATPVRPMAPNWRLQRLTSWMPTAKDKELGAKIFFFWEKGLAYDALPYASLPARVIPRLPASDRALFPGVNENRKTVHRYRKQFDAELLPYYALHLLSTVDPLVGDKRKQWDMSPPEVWHDMVGDYPIRYEKTQISLRAPGVSDHIIEGLASAIDDLDVNGLYFDHGMIKDSNNPANGAWIDCRGKLRGSLDIWATRDFFKRLRVEFERRGKSGITIVHDSNREIIPAYTFVFGLLDGEQFRNTLKDGDFLQQTSISQFRARFAPTQYGIPTYWLAEEWYNHEKDPSWFRSEDARRAYRKMMALALLHDVLDWPHEAHPGEREWLLKTLDAFDIARSDFYGYWTDAGLLRSANSELLISRYTNTATNRTLHVVANVSDVTQSSTLLQAASLGSITIKPKSGVTRPIKEGSAINVSIPPRDFVLIFADTNDGLKTMPKTSSKAGEHAGAD